MNNYVSYDEWWGLLSTRREKIFDHTFIYVTQFAKTQYDGAYKYLQYKET